MIRNVLLLLSSAAILLLIFFGYSRIVSDPVREHPDQEESGGALPQVADPRGEALQVGDITIPPGSEFTFKRYDPASGRFREQLRGREWRPVPGARDEVLVEAPELTIRLPSGMLAVISAREAQLRIDRVSNKRAEPKLGWLEHDVRIDIDRETAEQRTPLSERPEDRITITMPRLDFDLELGKLATDGAIRVENIDFELQGVGLALEWNQGANRVESLLIRQGDQLVLYGGGGLLGNPLDTVPVEEPPAPAELPEPRRRPRPPVAYEFSLVGHVVATQCEGDEAVGSLSADQLRILFDLGGRAAGSLLERRGRMRRPRSALEARLVVQWSGPLQMGPAAPRAVSAPPRRHFIASGEPVVLTRAASSIRCARLEYFDETQQIWLYAPDAGRVDFDLGPDLVAAADSVYVDRNRNLVKLIGNVALQSRESSPAQPGGGGRRTDIRAAHWAELYLVADGQAPQGSAAAPADAPRPTAADSAAADPLLASGGIERAVFVGDVSVGLRGQQLSAQRLEARFRPRSGDEPIENLLTSVIAAGGARLAARERSAQGPLERLSLPFQLTYELLAQPLSLAAQLRDRSSGASGEMLEAQEARISFAVTADRNDLYPRQLDAIGGVHVRQGRDSIRGERVIANLDPPPPRAAPSAVAAQAPAPAFVLREVEVRGRAELQSPAEQVAVRGDRVVAAFGPGNELHTALVRSDGGRMARVRAGPYAVHGHNIVVDQPEERLQVHGPSQLVLLTQRSLQGASRSRTTPLTVKAAEELDIDGKRNLVTFTGQVDARSGQEYLLADRMTLRLENAATPPAAPPNVWSAWREQLGRQGLLGEQRDPALRGATRPLLRKEPLRLEAVNATVVSETPDAAGRLPLVHSSLQAPQLTIEIPERVIRSVGLTQLLMTNRRLSGDAAAEREALGVPSALLTRGPSQTAMQSQGGMTYAIGQARPLAEVGVGDAPAERQDSVLFEGGVVFVHRAGREMVNLEQMLPQIAGDKQALARLTSRATYLECRRLECTFLAPAERPDQADSAAALPSLGGMGVGASGASLRLGWLMAQDAVYLRDRQGPGVREVRGDRMEFDRSRAVVGIFGSPAVVEFQNLETQRYDLPARGPRFEIDLNSGLVRSAEVQGQFNRP